ncbi:hypothetical protein V8D89_007008 [Ganoderma adspersum]
MDNEDMADDSCTGPQPVNIVVSQESTTKPTSTSGVEEPFTRDPDFWLEDGSITLLAGNTAFRVYRGLLRKHSVVSADMFTTATADAGVETFEDCPVVRLPDHPEDLKDVLTCMMPCFTARSVSLQSFLLPVMTDTSPSPHRTRINAKARARSYRFAACSAAIHLAHKYQCPDVELRARHVQSRPRRPAVATVNIASLTGTLSMFSLAPYLACTLEEHVLDGYARRDSIAENITPEDLWVYMRARRALARENAALVKVGFEPATTALEGRCQDTTERGMCEMGRDDIFDDAQYRARRSCDVLCGYGAHVERLAGAFGVCDVCKEARLERETEERRKAWMLLPGMFGLTVEECGFGTGAEDVDEPQEL